MSTLTLKDQPEQPPQETPLESRTEVGAPEASNDEGAPAKATSCNLCGLSFATLADQRSHARSDLHGYNLKQKIKGLKPVDEAEFEKLIGDLDESISGSESSESDEDEQEGSKPKDSTLNIGPHYFLCMIGGGHFAAMIVALAPKTGKKHTGVDERSATVIAHKTFHKYTTRRKQGGSQSANDNAKGNAHSAGSSIRRYNETALINEVRELLSSWKSMIDTAELVFVRATGATNRRTLFGPYDGQVLHQNDPRNRGFPFSTRRATQKELMRAFVELTRVKQSTIDEAALAALDNPEATRTTTTPAPAKPKPPKLTKEEELAALHTSQIIPLIKRSKVPALVNYLRTNNVPPTFTFFPVNHHTPTPLHLAASLSSAPIVLALLTKAGADPTLMNDEARTSFMLTGDRATRDAFRVARSELGESAWNWEQAGVPAAMTKAEADKRDLEEKAEKAAESKAEADRRKAETERVRKESEAADAKRKETRLGKGKTLGVPVKTGADLREEEMRGLTPEARARLERERRALAAMKRMQR
ncbi:C2H2 finger and ankyrin domain [Pyrenophora seminiperda CCB06]|uniref:C2H2 finger and ankyrin domain n=1 Tax=Pyrenophora seminiperda CCB06 TaxID=1302712 RepID=A0A3M7M023_9PLEO|nr:C2H2 finger and ankyrin domain [Pyrenophora seminiperda CCB06]